MYDHPAFPFLLIWLPLAFLFLTFTIFMAISVFICWAVYSCYERIPQQFRVRESWMVWLLLIPLFNLVWIFFIYPSLATSYKKYFDSIGRTDVGDCGYSIALAYCICSCCSIVTGFLTGIAALVLLIIFLVKAWELRSQIPLSSAYTPAVPPPNIPPPGPAIEI
ncbi:MAG TPA: hypothetical protein VKJ65_13190 [Phycisphaerae bacterium]|nr:hypothetical protein [Phycisphaerae bacterium]